MTKRMLLCVMALAICVAPAVSARAELKVGIASINVTPDPLLPVSGGVPDPGERPPAATKKQGELEARALVIENSGTKVAIVSVPYLGFSSTVGNKVREQVKGIKPENIIIGSTHVHSAPDMYAFPINEKGETLADLKYIEKSCSLVAKCINEANGKLAPASVKIAQAEAAERIAYNYYAPKLYDRRCNVMQFLGADGKAIATLVNYAIHPEVIGPNQGICSPDVIGPLHDRIAAQGGGMAIFMNSAQGGMVTADCRGEDGKDVQTWDECVRIGNLLADEALRIVKDAPVQEDPMLYCAAKRISFPIESDNMKFIVAYSPMKASLNSDGTISTTLNLVNFGTAQILTIPGEALPNIGFYLKRKMYGEQNFLFGLTNDAFGYILTKEDFNSFERYNYVTRTSLGEQTGPILIDESLKLVEESPRPTGAKS
ncbi:MAG: hypothetical protein HUU46_13170 [Candidatus Hydrogenedentes bacterium]|nr:hypothetical protein [Candidatus Hydrogenedentota bacterium]